MSIRRIMPMDVGYSGLSDRAKRALLTLGRYGGESGILLGGTRLNPSLDGGVLKDSSAAIYSLTGRRPAIHKWMMLDPELPFFATQNVKPQATQDYEDGIAACQAHWADGGLIHIALMLPNIVSGADWHDRQRDDITPVSGLKTGGSHNSVWLQVLDRLAYTLKTRLVDSLGRPIPVSLSWFPEANGWLDYLPNEGPDAAIQVAGRTITALSRASGQPAVITFTSRASAGVPFVPGVGGVFNIYGSANTAYNGSYYVNEWVSGTAGDPVGGGAVTIKAWKNGAQPGAATVDVSAGNTKSYPASGGWSAGLDRSADLMTVIRQSLDYLRGSKGCADLISSTAPFPDQYWSSRESNTNASGQAFSYDNWHPGDAYIDVGGMNVYRPNSSATMDTPAMISSSARHRQLHGRKPFIVNELGFDMEGDITPASAFRSQADFWPREWARMRKAMPYVSAACIWSSKFVPSVGDAALPGFVSLVQGGECITLDQLKRLV